MILMKLPYFLLFFLFSFEVYSNPDSIKYERSFAFEEGIYLNFWQFRNNDPVPKESLISDYSKNDNEFILKVLSKNSVSFIDSAGAEHKVRVRDIWGYSINREVFIRTGDAFSKVQIIGSICHFVGSFESYSTLPDPIYGQPQMRTEYRKEQAVIDMQTGNIMQFTVSTMETLLKKDEQLYKEFTSLKNKKKRSSIFIFMQKFNRKHPLYFPSRS